MEEKRTTESAINVEELTPQQQFSFAVLKKAASIAEAAGLESKLDLKYMHLFIEAQLGSERQQGVIVRDKTVNPNLPVLGIFSPCLQLKRAEIEPRLPELSYKLLKANEGINFASYALMENSEEVIVIASWEALLEEVTPKAFRAAVMAVALAANLFRERLDRDEL